MKLRGKWISVVVATVLSSVPIVHMGPHILDFVKDHIFWRLMVVPWMPGALLHPLCLERFGFGLNWEFVGGFVSGLLCWFALAEGIRALVKRQSDKAWLRSVGWLLLFLVLYGFGLRLLPR
jgi:hypothetical protein